MSEKQKQHETCIMINDTSQRSAVIWLRTYDTILLQI